MPKARKQPAHIVSSRVLVAGTGRDVPSLSCPVPGFSNDRYEESCMLRATWDTRQLDHIMFPVNGFSIWSYVATGCNFLAVPLWFEDELTHTHTHTHTHTCTHTHKVLLVQRWVILTVAAERCDILAANYKIDAHTHTHTHTHKVLPVQRWVILTVAAERCDILAANSKL